MCTLSGDRLCACALKAAGQTHMMGHMSSPPPTLLPPSSPPLQQPVWCRIARTIPTGALVVLALVIAGAIAAAPFRGEPAPGPTFSWPFRLTGRTNVLIMGLDHTTSDENRTVRLPISRTDSLIAASFDPGSRRLSVLSVPRDIPVPIPGHGTQRILAAHVYGGAALTLRTTENFLGVSFPYYIEITERGFVHLIDAVGGVTVRIPQDMNYDDNWDGLHIHLRKGNRRLGGESAMEFVRFRHDALGDIGRAGRQQQLIGALLSELHQPRTIFRMDRILRVVREDITTNLGPDQMIALALFASRRSADEIVRVTLPGSFAPTGEWLPDGARDRQVVSQMFYGMDAAALARTTIEVMDGTAGRGAVADALARLGALGVRILRVSAAQDATETAVLVHRGDDLAVANIIAAAVGARQVVMTASGGGPPGPDITLILARDYSGISAHIQLH
jgi:polyisoprenyl-teichoic acid--peptidoglycan teichoic acid transferase